jgi:cell division protein FtsZ
MEAMQAAISSPLLEDVSLDGATGLLVNITGGPNLTLREVDEAVSMAQSAADPDANIIFGSVVDEGLGDEVRITVIATGFQPREGDKRPAARPVQVAVPVSAPVKAVPPPLPLEARAKDPIRLAQPVAAPAPAPAVVTAPARAARRDPASFKPLEAEDQYDIPAFLRRGQTPRE